MLYPTIDELTKGKFNRYELAVATAKCARLITDEYVKQRTAAESALTGAKEGGTIISLIDRDLADKKAVKNAIDGIKSGLYEIVDGPEKEPLQMAEPELPMEEEIDGMETTAPDITED